MQITGRHLKCGDKVQRAMSTFNPTDPTADRRLGGMDGIITSFNPRGGSGAGPKTGSATVRWESGFEGRYDADMLVRVP